MNSYKILKKALEKARADVKRTEEEIQILDGLLDGLERYHAAGKDDIYTVEIEGYIYWLKNNGYWEV